MSPWATPWRFHPIRREIWSRQNLSLDYAGSAQAGDWLEARVDIQKQGSRLSFANCYIFVNEQRIVRASAVFLAAG